MKVILVGIPPSLREQLEQGLQPQGSREHGSWLYAAGLEQLPPHLPEGLVVLGDAGHALADLERLCRELPPRRDVPRTHLVVLTGRGPGELRALIQAGADECVAPPGGDWFARVSSLSRRQKALERSPAPPAAASSEGLSLRAAMEALLDSTQADLGYLFFSNLVEHLSQVFGASCVLLGELLPERDSIRTLAFWHNGSLQRGIVYPLRGTPCDEVIRKSVYHCPEGMLER